VTTPREGIGRAIARKADSSGLPALYAVLQVRGFGAHRRVLVRYIGHASGATLVQDPDAVPTVAPVWLGAHRFRLWLDTDEVGNPEDFAARVKTVTGT
jgi:hypothetical protein